MLPAVGVLLAVDVALSLLRGTSVLQLSIALAAAIPIGTVVAAVVLIAALRTIGAPVARALLSQSRLWIGVIASRVPGVTLPVTSSEQADRRLLANPDYVPASELRQIALADQNALLLDDVRARLAARDERDGLGSDCVLVGGLLLSEWALRSPTLVGALRTALAAQEWPHAALGVVAVALVLLWIGTKPAPLFDDRLYWPDRAARLNALRARATAAQIGDNCSEPPPS